MHDVPLVVNPGPVLTVPSPSLNVGLATGFRAIGQLPTTSADSSSGVMEPYWKRCPVRRRLIETASQEVQEELAQNPYYTLGEIRNVLLGYCPSSPGPEYPNANAYRARNRAIEAAFPSAGAYAHSSTSEDSAGSSPDFSSLPEDLGEQPPAHSSDRSSTIQLTATMTLEPIPGPSSLVGKRAAP